MAREPKLSHTASADYRRGVEIGYREGIADGAEIAAALIEKALPQSAAYLRKRVKEILTQPGEKT